MMQVRTPAGRSVTPIHDGGIIMTRSPSPLARHLHLFLAAALLVGWPAIAAAQADEHVLLVTNDLGMHCMNRNHAVLSVLPPYNTLQAQVIRKGDATRLPALVTDGLTLHYAFPGNTWSAGKTDFWTWAPALFGVDLPLDTGLTGKTLDDTFDLRGDLFVAEGIPLTPFTDAAPTVEDPYQQALVVVRDAQGAELTRAYPVAPVSIEMSCVTTGCHGSEASIVDGHPREGGFDPAQQPILCARCHGSTPLTGPQPGTAGWFSFRMHDHHTFIDQEIPGLDGCQKCHPGPNTRCLRGTMATDHGMICQDCHGTMRQMASSIEQGRTPWVDEPACRTCHTTTYGEPVGTLYRNARGHGGVLCSGCHNSPHAIFPSRESRDNQVMVDLQGHAGTLSDCRVCHGVTPAGAGPHGIVAVSAVEDELLGGAAPLRVFPSPAAAGVGCTIVPAGALRPGGRLLIYDVRGRTVRMLSNDGAGAPQLAWDGRDARGRPVASGVYFLRYQDGATAAAGKVVMVD